MEGRIVLDETYWTKRYDRGEIGWNIGHVSTPLKEYIDQLNDKDMRILIPGAGNAYEAEYLWSKGFKNVSVVDISEAPLENLKKRVVDFPEEQLLHKDFFQLEEQFDLILEQTFFCALDPSLRARYVEKAKNLLKSGGKLVGVLFQIPLNSDRPPFGGDKAEYLKLFSPHFRIKVMETAYNSIPPRKDNELFINFQKEE